MNSEIIPNQVTPAAFPGESIMDAIVLASSNALRSHLQIPAGGIIREAIPKFATRFNPSVDNYFADLLLRSCYPPSSFLPALEEYVIRGREDEEEATLSNPGLYGATLIGIGNKLSSRRFHATYDEHIGDGKRSAPAACHIVHERHLASAALRSSEGYERVLEEIGRIDSQGEAGGMRHIYSATKLLHKMRLKFPDYASQRIPINWKRAIVEASLVAVILHFEEVSRLEEAALDEKLETVWERAYLPRMRIGIHSHYFEGRPPEYVDKVKPLLFKRSPAETKLNYVLTLDRISVALSLTWAADVADLLISLLLEALVQGESTYVRVFKICEQVFGALPSRPKFTPLQIIPIQGFVNGPVYHHVLLYRMHARDVDPHRAISSWMRDQKVKGIIVLRNPQLQTTAIFGNTSKSGQRGALENEIWTTFCETLCSRESDGRWYHLTKDTGEKAQYILNGTESMLTPPTRFSDRALIDIFATRVREYCKLRRA